MAAQVINTVIFMILATSEYDGEFFLEGRCSLLVHPLLFC